MTSGVTRDDGELLSVGLARPGPHAEVTGTAAVRDSRRRWLAALVTWAAAAAALTGLVAGSLAAAQPGTADVQDAFFPSGPGTTSVFETTADGKPTGLHISVVTGPALLVGLPGQPKAVRQTDHYDNYNGGGSPLDETGYVGWSGGELLSYGFRSSSGQFIVNTPPEPVMRPRVAPGQGWRWTGREGPAGSQSSVALRATWSFLGHVPVEVLGRRLDHCRHYRSTTMQVGSAHPAPRDVVDSWMCAGLGTVKTRESYEGHVYTGTLVHFSSASRTVTAPGASAVLAGPANRQLPGGARSAAGPRGPRSAGRALWGLYLMGDAYVVSDASVIVTATTDGVVSAIDKRTGEVLWKMALPSPITTTPVLAGGIVMVGDGAKQLHAFDLRTGASQWTVTLPDLLAAAPVAENGVVVVAVQDDALRAFTLPGGRPLWSVPLASMPTEPPVVAGQTVVVGEEEGALKAVSLTTGEDRWEVALGSPLAAGPVAGGHVVVASDDQGVVYGFAASSGRRRWERYLGATVDYPPALAAGRVLAVAGDRRLVALSAKTGRSLWSTTVDGNIAGTVAVDGTTILAQGDDGTVTRLSLSSGSVQGDLRLSQPAGATVARSVALSGGDLVTTFRCQSPYEATYAVSIEAAAPATSDRPGNNRAGSGVGFTVTARKVTPPVGWSGPIAPPAGWDGGMVFSGWDERVWDIAGSGPPRMISRTGLSFFAVPDGNLVLAQEGQYLVALPRQGGRPLWKFPLGATSVGGPVVSGHLVVFDAGGRGLVALDGATGRPRWFLSDAGQDTSRPLVLPGGDIAWAGPRGLVRVDAGTGRRRWVLPGVASGTPLAFDEGMVFVDAQGNTGAGLLIAVHAGSGKVAWARTTPPLDNVVGPVAASGVVVVPAEADFLEAFDAGTGRMLWSSSLRSALDGPLTVMSGRLVVAQRGRNEDLDDQAHTITVHQLHTGRLLGLLELPGAGSSDILAQSFGRTGANDLVEYGTPYLYTARLLAPTKEAP